MSYITQLDDSKIDEYVRLDATNGKGTAAIASLDHLIQLYQNMDGSVFGPGDESSAHVCSNLLIEKFVALRDLLDETDTKIDDLVKKIHDEIIVVENERVNQINTEG